MTPHPQHSGHTPLPWHIKQPGEHDKQLIAITTLAGNYAGKEIHRAICKVSINRSIHDSGPSAQEWADAKLICAAPSLLEACKVALDQCEKLRLTINPLLVELPTKSIVNGEDNFPFRLKVLKIQVESEQKMKQLRAAIALATQREGK